MKHSNNKNNSWQNSIEYLQGKIKQIEEQLEEIENDENYLLWEWHETQTLLQILKETINTENESEQQ